MTSPSDALPQDQARAPYQRHWNARAREVLAALPAGAIEAGRCSIRRGLAAAAHAEANAPWTTEAWIAERLIEPLLLATDWPPPNQPLPVGGGAVHADLTDDDHELFSGLRQTMEADAEHLDAEALAAAAQELRLPVTPYRRPPTTHTILDTRAFADTLDCDRSAANSRSGSSSGWQRSVPLVVDMTALWAGPLATTLLTNLGARVVKIDPSCRPDGLRQHGSVYQAFNGDKTIIDLDLRQEQHREQFESLLREADLVVDSFSRRVMPNLGYGPGELQFAFPELSTLSIVAFPAGSPEQDWVSYGPGVHAASGLAFAGEDVERFSPRAAAIAYPDVLAGLAAFAAASELLAGTGGKAHREVSLAGALKPLVDRLGTS